MLAWMLAVGLGARAAHAQEIIVSIDEELAAQYGVDSAAVEKEIRDASSEALKMDEPQIFVDEMASANAFATKGMGVDYATNPQRFFVGGAVGTATSGGGFTFIHGEGDLPAHGFAFQAAANAGLNLGVLSKDESFLRRIVVSANGMWAKGASGPFDAELYNLGGHLQIKLVRPPHKGVVEWGGLDVTAGYEVSAYRLLLSSKIPVATTDLTWDAEGTMDIRAVNRTIPVELSTNLRVVIFTVYAGGALDIRHATTAYGSASLGGPLSASYNGKAQEIGTVTAKMDVHGNDEAQYVPRAFGGVQINILMVKVYGHLNVGFDDTWAGHLGLRVAL